MNYSEMSDFEVNGMVSAATQRAGDYTQARGVTFIHEYSEPTGELGAICCLGWKEFDPCNSWADAGPIILENSIGLIAPFAGFEPEGFAIWNAYDPMSQDRVFSHENPLRAAMIVFLMMNEPKRGGGF